MGLLSDIAEAIGNIPDFLEGSIDSLLTVSENVVDTVDEAIDYIFS